MQTMKTTFIIILLASTICSAQQQLTTDQSLVGGSILNGKQYFFTIDNYADGESNSAVKFAIYDSSFKVTKNGNFRVNASSASIKYLGDFFIDKTDLICFLVQFINVNQKNWTYVVNENGQVYKQLKDLTRPSIMGNNKDGYYVVGYVNERVYIEKLSEINNFDTIKSFQTIVVDTVYQIRKDTVYLSETTIIQDPDPVTIISKDVSKLLTVFPNPSSTFINVPYSITENGSIKFYNISGKLILDTQLPYSSNSIVVDVRTWQKGEYSYIIYSGSSKDETGKFIRK